MRARAPPAVLLASLLLLLAPGGIAPGFEAAATREVRLEVVAYACGSYHDGVCLGYDGATPGPLLDVVQGDRLAVTLVNRIAETVAALDVPDEVKETLSQARVSWHVHGTSLPSSEDGIAAHPGTELVDSAVPPGGSFTYHVRARNVGAWHYHDHVLGPDGKEGVARGLYGSLVVRPLGAPLPGAVLDLHLVDAQANNGAGLRAALPAGTSFEVNLVSLGNHVWDFELRSPSGSLVRRLSIGPGESYGIPVLSPQSGAYAWTATSVMATLRGEVKVG